MTKQFILSMMQKYAYDGNVVGLKCLFSAPSMLILDPIIFFFMRFELQNVPLRSMVHGSIYLQLHS